ncbi:hypothetical protein [Sandaracinus amylolyticus]|uniref:Putative hemagglutinin/hemolysin-related protein n=1 Tax=Sandaracinus amylolyticus TaxID=927083 RepID=A0A0F6YK19_9BACT|nr:hypothetical protein [Sandaracinus amylolyticus]AKF07588.1 Putative hemagglutinin/hemolysin-related protein [Sandaracinus amylolyticus]
MRLCFVCLALVALTTACTAETAPGRGVALRDPLGLIDDVYGAGNSLRLYVLPAGSFACTPASGTVLPDPPDVQETFSDAVVDVTLTRDDLASYSVELPPGDYVVLARGKGTDPVSGRMNVFIATGCATSTVADGETVGVTVVLAPIVGMGECGDGILSPDEQCETGAPTCTDCRTVAETLNTSTDADQTAPRVAARSGQRVAVAWEDDATNVRFRLFDPNGRPLTGGLAVDTEATLAGVQNGGGIAVAPDGRVALSLVDFPAGDVNARVVFYSPSLMQQATPELRADRTGIQNGPAIAYHSSGAAMAVFQDASSPTGLSGRAFATGTTAPSGAEAFEVGTGQAGGTTPAIAATSSGFVVAFAALGQIYVQRFGTDGAPVDAAAQPVADAGGMRTAPALAALADGTFLVAWAEANGDGMGSGIRARVFSDAGVAADAPFTVNSTLAGDQLEPAVGAAGDRFLVAFRSGNAVRAAVRSPSGDPSLNREQPPTLGDFEVAGTGARPAVAVIGAGADQAWWVVYQAPGAGGLDIFGRRFPL